MAVGTVARVVRVAAYVVAIVAGVVLVAAFLLGVAAGVAAFLAVHALACSVREGYRQRPRPVPAGREPRHGEQQQQRGAAAGKRQRASGPTTAAGLPSFTYSPPVVVGHKVTVSGGGAEAQDAAATTCSVCLDALELGQTVRLLPACQHMYHAECIDPWLAKLPTCPICRSPVRLRPEPTDASLAYCDPVYLAN